jgi:hypothetical protein
MPYIVNRHFKDGRVVASPGFADHAAAIDEATRAWKERTDIAQVTVEDDLGQHVWAVSPDGTFTPPVRLAT